MEPRTRVTPGFARGAFWASLFTCCCLALAFTAARAAAEPVPYAPPEGVNTEPEPPAEPAECPTSPAPIAPPSEEEEAEEGFEAPDPVLAELRDLRVDLATTCAAGLERQERQLSRQWWQVAEAVGASVQREESFEQLVDLVAKAEGGNSKLNELLERSDCGDPCRVLIEEGETPLLVSQPESAASSEDLVASVDASGEAMRSGIYLVAGILAGLIIALMLWQTWRRAA
jgi:hypothetical protein